MIDIIVAKMSKVQSLMAAETMQLCSSFLTLAATNSQRSSAELTNE